MAQVDGPFRKLIDEYGSKALASQAAEAEEEAQDGEKKTFKTTFQKEGQALMLEEEREIGSVSPATWVFWLRNMEPVVVPLTVGVLYVVSSGARLSNVLFVGFWQQTRFPALNVGAYQGIYAGEYASRSKAPGLRC